MKFAAIDPANSRLSIRAQCEALGVSEQGYHQYANQRDTLSTRQRSDEELLPHIIAAHETGRGNYGTPRLKVELATHDICISRRRIARLREIAGLAVRCRRRFVRTTDSRHNLRIAPNLLAREFVASEPNTVWVSDITYLWSEDHWLYLCTIIDCFSGAIVGRKLSRAIDAALVQDTFAMAVGARRPGRRCLFHSDRGSQYASDAFRKDLKTHRFIPSMSRRKNCWDNAVAESSFGRLKTELGDTFASDYEAMTAVYEYIDIFYNLIRIHSRHDMAPLKFEQQQLLAA
jgi:putative transposase